MKFYTIDRTPVCTPRRSFSSFVFNFCFNEKIRQFVEFSSIFKLAFRWWVCRMSATRLLCQIPRDKTKQTKSEKRHIRRAEWNQNYHLLTWRASRHIVISLTVSRWFFLAAFSFRAHCDALTVKRFNEKDRKNRKKNLVARFRTRWSTNETDSPKSLQAHSLRRNMKREST